MFDLVFCGLYCHFCASHAMGCYSQRQTPSGGSWETETTFVSFILPTWPSDLVPSLVCHIWVDVFGRGLPIWPFGLVQPLGCHIWVVSSWTWSISVIYAFLDASWSVTPGVFAVV